MTEDAAAKPLPPELIQIQQVGMGLAHLSGTAGTPDAAVMALTYALAHVMANNVDLDAPGAVEGILVSANDETARMYRLVVAKRIELQAQEATAQ